MVKRKFVFRSLHVLAKTLNKHVSQTVSGHHRTAMRYVTTIRIQRISGIHLLYMIVVATIIHKRCIPEMGCMRISIINNKAS